MEITKNIFQNSMKKFSLDDTNEYYLGQLRKATNEAEEFARKDPTHAYADHWKAYQTELNEDTQISSLYNSRRNAVIQLPINIEPAVKDDIESEIIENINKYIVKNEGFSNFCNHLLSAPAFGFSACQIIWVQDGNIWRPEFNLIPQNWLSFTPQGELSVRTKKEPYYGEVIPKEDFDKYWLLLRYNDDARQPWGRGFLMPCFFLYTWKKFIINYYNLYCQGTARQRFILVGPKADKLTDELNQFYATGWAGINGLKGDFDMFTFGGVGTADTNAFITALNYYNEQIAKAIRGATLMSEGSGGQGATGSFALSQTHQTTGETYTAFDAEKLADEPLAKLCEQFTILNYGEREAYCTIRFDYTPAEDAEKRQTILDKAVSKKIKVTMKQYQEELNIIPPEEGDELVEYQEPVSPFGQFGGGGSPFQKAGITPQNNEEKKNESNGKSETKWEKIQITNKLEFAKKKPDVYTKVYARIPDDILEWYDDYYYLIDDLLLKGDNVLTERDLREFNKQIAKEDGKPSHLADVLAGLMLSYYFQGQVHSWELGNGYDGDIIIDKPFNDIFSKWSDRMPVLSEQYYAPEITNAVREKYFTISKTEDERIVAGVQDALNRAISEGQTQKYFKDSLSDLFSSKGLTELNPYHIENIYRSNASLAYNAGTYTLYNDPNAFQTVPIITRYGVMDDRIRDTHAELNGLTAPADHPTWLYNYPPFVGGEFQFQCRCRADINPGAQMDLKGAPMWGEISNPFESFIS